MKKIMILTLLMVLIFGSILGITGVIVAEEQSIVSEEDFKVECMAAPAVAGLLLEDAGIDNRYGTGRNGGNYISNVAHHMSSETDFDGVDKCDVIAYECAIAAYLNSLGESVGVTSQYTDTVDPIASGATWKDNKDSTGTMHLTVLDKCGDGIEGLNLIDIKANITWVGLTDLFTLGAGGYWDIYLSENGSGGTYEITFHRLGSVPYERNWDIIVKNEVIEEDLYVTVTDVSAVLESVVYEGTGNLFGTHIDDIITFTFSNDVFHDPNVTVKFKTALRLWEGWWADNWTMDGNTATVTLNRLYGIPRDIIGDEVIGILGIVDALGNPVIVPDSGVEITAMVGTWDVDLYIGNTPYARFIVINNHASGEIFGNMGTGTTVQGNINGTVVGRSIFMHYDRIGYATDGYFAVFNGTITLDGNSASGTWQHGNNNVYREETVALTWNMTRR